MTTRLLCDEFPILRRVGDFLSIMTDAGIKVLPGIFCFLMLRLDRLRDR